MYGTAALQSLLWDLPESARFPQYTLHTFDETNVTCEPSSFLLRLYGMYLSRDFHQRSMHFVLLRTVCAGLFKRICSRAGLVLEVLHVEGPDRLIVRSSPSRDWASKVHHQSAHMLCRTRHPPLKATCPPPGTVLSGATRDGPVRDCTEHGDHAMPVGSSESRGLRLGFRVWV